MPNRSPKLPVSPHVKWASVAADGPGVPGRAMSEAIIAGREGPEAFSHLVRRLEQLGHPVTLEERIP